MKSLGLNGTFYTVSGWVNQPSYLTLAQVQQIQADGNEIAGHTIEHPDLPTLAAAEQEREICNDRVNLINWGFKPTDFAYPFSDADTTETYAKACGYNSARGLGDVVDPQGDCNGCVYAETTPPPDPYYLRAPDEVDSTVTLAKMEAAGDQCPDTQRRLGHPHLPPHLQRHRCRGLPGRSIDHADHLQRVRDLARWPESKRRHDKDCSAGDR